MSGKERLVLAKKALVGKRKKDDKIAVDVPQARLTSIGGAGCTATVTIESEGWPELGRGEAAEGKSCEDVENDTGKLVMLPRGLASCGKKVEEQEERNDDGMASDSSGRGRSDKEPDTSKCQTKPRCFLCLGNVKDGEGHIECEWCGRKYHRSCARRVGRCPQCGDELLDRDG